MLTVALWASLILIVYVYLGYPLLIFAWSRTKHGHATDSEPPAAVLPSVTLIIPACNEEQWIQSKIKNTLALNYPRESLQIIIASDGSTDRTVEIAREFEGRGIEVVPFAERHGKQEMLNQLVLRAAGEIIVASDAHAMLEPTALRLLVRHFADPSVGAVTGRRVCIVQAKSKPSAGESLYWCYESWIKESESRLHSCLGAHGQLYAVRKSVFPRVERVSDDFYIPMKVIAATGLRVIFEPEAIAHIPAAARLRIELERKVRAHAALLTVLPALRELLLPWRTPLWWQYISHHVLRMFVPLAMVLAFLSSAILAESSGFYRFVLIAQCISYGLAGIGFVLTRWGLRPKLFYVPFYFVFANVAVALAWLRWPVHEYGYGWQPTKRLPDVR